MVEGTSEALIKRTVEAVVEGTSEAVIARTVEAVVEGTVEGVMDRTVESVADTIAETDEGIPIVPEAVVTGGSVVVAAAIAMAIRLYVVGSTCLASLACFGNEFASVASAGLEPYMTQT